MVINWNDFYSHISAARLRAAEICLKIGQAFEQQQELINQCVEELYAALKNLELAQEMLSQQNHELTTARELVEIERQRYQDLFELVPNPYIVTDRRGKILEANLAAATLLNVPLRFLVGKPLAGFVSKEQLRVFLVKLTRLHEGNQKQDWKMHLQPRNGNSFDATVTVTTVHDVEGRRLMLGWLVRDFTDEKAAAPESLVTQAVQQSVPIVITSAELDKPGPKFVFVNQAFTQMTGYRLEEIVSKTPRILQGSKTDRSVLNQLRRCLLQGQPFQGEMINYRKDGSEYQVQISCFPIQNDRAEITHFMSIQNLSMESLK